MTQVIIITKKKRLYKLIKNGQKTNLQNNYKWPIKIQKNADLH